MLTGSKTFDNRCFLMFAFSLSLLFGACVLGNCSNTTTSEKVDETPAKEETATNKEKSAAEKVPIQEQVNEALPVEPQIEKPSPSESTVEKKENEPTAEATDAGSSPEPVAEKNDGSMRDASDGGPTTPCTGVRPPYPDVAATAPPEIEVPENLPEKLSPKQLCKYKPGQCPGSSLPVYKLEDFQPQSCGYKKVYSLQAFKGSVLVVVLLSGW